MANASAVTPGEDRIRLLFRMRARRLLWRMLEKQGIDPAGRWWQGTERMIARVAANCAACTETERCKAWLDTPADGSGTPAFCPNGRAIEAARIMDPRARPLGGTASSDTACETSLTQLMAEPVVKLLMRADGVNSEILRHAMTDAPRFTAAYAAPARRLRLPQGRSQAG
jgi:hypothetical protein